MKKMLCGTTGALLLCLTTMGSLRAADAPPGGIRLLEGYRHNRLQGIDSVVGEITKPGGLRIFYEIGVVPEPGGLRLGGMFTDRPKDVPKDQLRWYVEQIVNGQPAHLAYCKDDKLMVSFPLKGINLSAVVRTADEMAQALLMILTYSDPPAPPKPAK